MSKFTASLSKKHCKVCQDNGLSEAQYSSHFPRSGGQITCPLLHAQVCGACGKRGHIKNSKFCKLTGTVTAAVRCVPIKNNTILLVQQQKKKTSDAKNSFSFANLGDDSEEEEEKKEVYRPFTPKVKPPIRWVDYLNEEDSDEDLVRPGEDTVRIANKKQ